MVRTHRFQAVLLLTLGLAVALLGCDSGSGGTGGTAGSGGSGGSGGSNGGVLRILITNDDGVGADGIDAIVEALRDDPNSEIIVSAPATQQSSTGDSTTETPPPLEATETTTASGYPATAVMGFPADSVIYGLENLYPDAPPHVVLSGINEGQNVGLWNGTLLSQISGTVGAAKTAACLGVPALASSQGEGDVIDYDSGVAAVLAWLEANRADLLAGEVSLENITSINIPSCDTGSIRGAVEVPLGTEKPDDLVLTGPQDCESTLENPGDDIEGFFNGFTTITPVPSNSSMTCDKLN
ncbi:MAG: survival protein SurE [Deltaproteobacteria bacterium]|nr:survival protein SurE [Deltaproteobacteria bacterium]